MSGFIIGIHFGTPCIPWSRARTRPNGPQPLRSGEHILGLPALRNEGERWKIDMGNTTMKNTVRIASVASLHMVPFCIENPYLSFMWEAPQMLHLRRRHTTREIRTDFCPWGVPWMKPTRGRCSRANKPHVSLTGKSSNGIFKTRVAEEYP
eukprot:3882445-Pyramimonas_sp.AAC.1